VEAQDGSTSSKQKLFQMLIYSIIVKA